MLSELVKKAVMSRLFHMTVADIKERNQRFDPDEIMKAINEAVSDGRPAGMVRYD